jgi:hypothetical protein
MITTGFTRLSSMLCPPDPGHERVTDRLHNLRGIEKTARSTG